MAAAVPWPSFCRARFTFFRKPGCHPDLFRKHGVDIAIASDFNPGSSPVPSLLLMLNRAVLFPARRNWRRDTQRGSARPRRGSRYAGSRQARRPAIWNISQPAELAYWAGYNPLHTLIHDGTAIDFDAQLVSPGLAA